MPKMTKEDRYVNWEESAESIALKIRTSDSQPGAVAKFLINDGTLVSTDEYRVFGVHTEEGQLLRYMLKTDKITHRNICVNRTYLQLTNNTKCIPEIFLLV